MTNMGLRRAMLCAAGMIGEGESLTREYDEMPLDVVLACIVGCIDGSPAKLTAIGMLLARHIEGAAQ